MNKRMLVLLVLSLAFLLAAVPAWAARGGGGGAGPYSQGGFMVAGDGELSFNFGKRTIDPDGGDKVDTDTSGFDLQAFGGYYVINGLEVGPWLDFTSSSEEDDDGETKTSEWILGVQAGYFYPLAASWAIYGLLGVGYSSFGEEYNPDEENADNRERDASGFAFQPQFGAVFLINNHLGLTMSLFYRHRSGDGSEDTGHDDTDFDFTDTSYGLRLGLAGFFGI